MNTFRIRCIVATLAAAVASIPTFAAASLPVVAYSQEASETGFFQAYSFPITNYVLESDGSPATYIGATSSAATSPYPAVSASSSTGLMRMEAFGQFVTSPSLTLLNHDAISQLYYYFTVNGPSQVAVPLEAAFNLSASAGGIVSAQHPSFAVAQGVIGGDLLSCVAYAFTCYQTVDTRYPTIPYDPDVSFTMLTGALANVELYAQAATTQTSPAQSSTATAYADPYITIDPVWLAAHPGYSLSFSAGIVNAGPGSPAALPEPASWAMLLSGFGLVGVAMRRRFLRPSRWSVLSTHAVQNSPR